MLEELEGDNEAITGAVEVDEVTGESGTFSAGRKDGEAALT